MIHYRFCNESDIPHLQKLMNDHYQKKKSKEYFRWQFFNSVYSTVLVGAFHYNELIGMFGLQKKYLNNNLIAGQAIDLLVRNDFRSKGIFSMLGREAMKLFNDVDLFCVLPNAEGKNAVERAFSWKSLGKINTYVLSKQNFEKTRTILEAKKIKDKLEKKIEFKVDNEIMKWRFKDNPEFDYYLECENQGYSIFKIFRNPLSRESFGDIVYFNHNKNLNKALLNIINKLNKENVDNITIWDSTIESYILEELLFTKIDIKRFFCIYPNNIINKCFSELSNWRLFQCDAEHY